MVRESDENQMNWNIFFFFYLVYSIDFINRLNVSENNMQGKTKYR